MVYSADLKSAAARHTGSSPVSRTKQRLGSLMVKQRIYIPCATDNWPMSVRLRPEVPRVNKKATML